MLFFVFSQGLQSYYGLKILILKENVLLQFSAKILGGDYMCQNKEKWQKKYLQLDQQLAL